MAQVDVNIYKSKLEVVIGIKKRIELLFDVVVDFKSSPNESEIASTNEDGVLGYEDNRAAFVVRLSSPDSQENVEKAKIFLKAILEEGPDFNSEPFPLAHDELEMVRRSSEAIERQSLCVLDFDSDASMLFLKGQRYNIASASQQVHRLIMGRGDALVEPENNQKHSGTECETVYGQHETVHSTVRGGFPGEQTNGNSGLILLNSDNTQCNPYSSQDRDSENHLIIEPDQCDSMRSYSLATDGDYPSFSFPGVDLTPRGVSSRSTVTSSLDLFTADVSLRSFTKSDEFVSVDNRTKSSVSEQSSSSDEDSGVSVVDKSDSRYETRLEFALKLGYTEADLDRVINRHGLDCDGNRLLQELIEGSTSMGLTHLNIEEVETSVSPGLLTPDIASSEIFQVVMKKVKSDEKTSNLRNIVIDGSNVAMSHGKNMFSCRGIKIAVDWFKQRGHEEIIVFVPQWRKETSRPDTPITDQHLLLELEKEGIVVFTPARRIKGRRVVCYDDRFVLKLASETGGIVVSNDNYRDLLNENQEYRRVVDERLLMYTFVNDRFMPPEDPLGRRGPTLENFLCKEPTVPQTLPPDCPYGRKCTYGNKCKYHHPERGSQPHRTVTEVLKEQATLKMQERATRGTEDKLKRSSNKPKLMRTRSLAPGEPFPVPSDKSSASGPLPAALKEPDTEASTRVKSPTRSGKTADYLREHRKKLEEHLAVADSVFAASQPDFAKASGSGSKTVERPFATGTPEMRSPLPMLGSRVSSPSHLNVPPFSSAPEGPLISGHLLLAKKLSDEASESSFFSNEGSNRASPVQAFGMVSRPESVPFGLDRRQPLQDHALLPRGQSFLQSSSQALDQETGSYSTRAPGPMRYPSQPAGFMHDPAFMTVPQYGAQCQSYPPTDKEVLEGNLRRVTSYTDHPSSFPVSPLGMEVEAYKDHMQLKPQQSCPPNHMAQNPLSISGQSLAGKMVRQNSSSDPQLHTTWSGDPFINPWLPTSQTSNIPMLSGLDHRGTQSSIYSPADYRMASEVPQQQQQPQPQGLYRSQSVQQPTYRTQSSYTGHGHTVFDRQYSEDMYSPHDMAMHPHHYMPQTGWGGMEMFHTPGPAPHHHHQPHSQQQLQPRMPMPHSVMATAWSQQQHLPPSQTKAGQAAKTVAATAPKHSYPVNQSILASDLRYPLYYNLCGIFAEPRVRAAMNHFPDEKDPQILCAHIMSL